MHYVSTHTIGACINGSAGFGYWVTASGCVALVGGHPAVMGSVGGGGTTSATASVTGGLLISNAQSPDQLRGPFATVGASGKLGVAVGDDLSVGNDLCGNFIWENQIYAGVGVALPPIKVHAGVTYTWLHS